VIAGSAWDQMNVTVGDCLPCIGTIIDPDIEVRDRRIGFTDAIPRGVQQLQAGIGLRARKIEEALTMTLDHHQGVMLGNGKSIRD